ncbi:hypothetical protein HDU67_007702 [Dinochytrium kinnereticum]|nr:hypothetical protein HDU67_007702 [Dinochytrium kinnereticum]
MKGTHPCENLTTTPNPAHAAFLPNTLTALDPLMCAIGQFFADSKAGAKKSHEMTWTLSMMPLLDMFVSALVVVGVEGGRVWGGAAGVVGALVGTASQLAGVSLALPLLWVLPWVLGGLIWSKSPVRPLENAGQVWMVAVLCAVFSGISMAMSFGPEWMMRYLILVFQLYPTFAPLLWGWPVSLLLKGGKTAVERRKDASTAALNVYHLFAGMCIMNHITLLISLLPYFVPDPMGSLASAEKISSGHALLTVLKGLALKSIDTMPNEILGVVFLFAETLSVPVTMGVWIVAVRARTLVEALGVIVWYVVSVPFIGVGAAVMLAAAAREKEVEKAGALVSSGGEGGKKKKKTA